MSHKWCDKNLTFDRGGYVMATVQLAWQAWQASRAALQPQAAAWQTLSQQIQEAAIASGQKQRPRENNQGIASDAWLHPIGTCSPERDGENQHHEHRAGKSDAKCADCECDSECTRVSGGGQVRAEQIAQAAAEPVEAAKKDAVFQASIDFIRELTGMEPPPIEVAPPDTFKPFKTFTDKVCSIFATPPTTQAEAEQHTFNDESPFCVKCGSTGEDAEGPVAHILPRDLEILKFKSMPVPVDPLPYDNGEEKTVPLYTSPPATQAALTAASDCRTCQHLSEAWGVCEARPKCVGGEQYVYFPEKQLWDKTPRNDGQAAHQEMREALYAEFNSAVGRQHD